ncbi:flagellar filament capping protein FliD [Alteromonas sp. S015]|uniref:flagellar filament capping protein FliD n=1 Tax=Alteromonas sp. S015 TaxID=3117401 RepID=UPI002FDF1914
MTITNAGVGSGLDLEAIISATIQASNQPKLQKFSERESELSVQLTSIGAIKSVMSKLQDVFEGLSDPEEFNKRTANVRQPDSASSLGDLVSVSADNTATTGSFDISVSQLAQGSRAKSDPASTFTSADEVITSSASTLTFSAGANSFDIDIEAGATLEDIRQAINDASGSFGVSANIINTGSESLLVIESFEAGAGNDLVITNNNAELDRLSTVANGGGAGGMTIAAEDVAQDAIIEVDGIQITNSSNVFSDAVQGLSITARRVSESGEVANADVNFDREGVTTKIDEFIAAFNNTIDMISQQSTLVSSPLFGDATVRSIKNQLTNALTNQISGAGSFETIFDIGLSLNESGKLEKQNVVRSVEEALDEDFANVGKLFTNTDGLANTFGKILENYVDSSGILKQREDSINVQQDELEDDVANHQYRMERLEASLRDKYASLDTLIASMRSSGDYLMGQLASLPGFTRDSG